MAQITRHRHASFDIQSMRYVSFDDADPSPGEAVVTIPELDDPGVTGRNAEFADVFDDLGGFDELLGKADSLAQGEESELCRRVSEEYGQGVQYRPNAEVKHQVYPEQLAATHLVERAYAQGQTKRAIGVDDTETGFLQDVLGGLVRQAPQRSLATLVYTAATGGGFLRGPPADSPLLEVSN